MAENTQESTVIAPDDLIPRSEELDRFASLLPIEEFGMYATRIFNLFFWGGGASWKVDFSDGPSRIQFYGAKESSLDFA